MQQKNKIKTKKNITKLINENGEIKTEEEGVLKIAKDFYSDLYKKTNKRTRTKKFSEQIWQKNFKQLWP